ncbi:MAG: 3-dehydroquinate synthase [Ruminococcaceae bacterium]|nr:3-dehydroquinate synthase [Oscillospiraceae bacterium]
MDYRTVRVRVGKGYDVVIGGGLLNECGRLIAETVGNRRIAIITDTNVEKLYLEKTLSSIRDAGVDAVSFVFPAGEENKNIGTLAGILEFLAENKFTREDVVVALGGGVVGDIAGFAAAVYLRGIRYIQLPTTLLAAVDSSVGGKTAIDLAVGKNLAGAFKQPELVVCDTDTFETLPQREFSNGMAEAIKYGVLFDRELFDLFMEDMSRTLIDDVVERCVRHKGCIVEIDELEKNERRLLNLGHTIGHAIEKCSHYGVTHGHGVSTGMAMIARAGEALGMTEKGTAERIEAVLARYDLPIDTEFDKESLVNAALSDKKRRGGSITLVIPKKIGECILHTEPVEKLSNYIELGRKN